LASAESVERPGLTGPVVTIQATVGALGVLALVLALTAGSATVALTALGVIGLVPLALGAVIRGYRWRGREGAARRERAEDAAILIPAVALCWQPIVMITDLREQIFHGGVVGMVAGAAAMALGFYCARP